MHVTPYNVHMTKALHSAGIVPRFELKHRVKLAREVSGMQQTELAEKTGLSRTTIVNIERGDSIPRRSSLTLIAFATGVDRNWLENGETPAGDNPGGGEVVRHQGLEPRTHCLTSKDSRRAVTPINELPNPAPKDGNGGDKKAA